MKSSNHSHLLFVLPSIHVYKPCLSNFLTGPFEPVPQVKAPDICCLRIFVIFTPHVNKKCGFQNSCRFHWAILYLGIVCLRQWTWIERHFLKGAMDPPPPNVLSFFPWPTLIGPTLLGSSSQVVFCVFLFFSLLFVCFVLFFVPWHLTIITLVSLVMVNEASCLFYFALTLQELFRESSQVFAAFALVLVQHCLVWYFTFSTSTWTRWTPSQRLRQSSWQSIRPCATPQQQYLLTIAILQFAFHPSQGLGRN